MSFLEKVFVLLSIFPLACFSEEIFEPDLFPRPVTVDWPEINEAHLGVWPLKENELQCTSWRVAGEANNLGPWRTIPEECADYIQEYMEGEGYQHDIRRVSFDARIYARSLNLSLDGKDAWIFDIDETLLSNLPYYTEHGYGLEIFDSTKFDEWVEMGMASAIKSSLKLYKEVLRLGFKVILLTGRSERHRNVTIENLYKAGFQGWEKLILRSSEDHIKSAKEYKSEKRNELVEEGYTILGSAGDQWSDLLGSSMSQRSFKLSNPVYYIS